MSRWLFIPLFVAFSPGIPCGDDSLFRCGVDDVPGIECCVSDSFSLVKRVIIRDSFPPFSKSSFLHFDAYTSNAGAEQLFYVRIKNTGNGKVYYKRLTPENSANYFSVMVPLKQLRPLKATISVFAITWLKVDPIKKDTAFIDAGVLHVGNK